MKALKKLICLAAACMAVMTIAAGCGSKASSGGDAEDAAKRDVKWQYYTAEQLKTAIEGQTPMHLIDIQPEEDYKAHHIVGTVPYYAYPVDTDELRSKLDAAVEEVSKDSDPIIIVCPGGGSGAKRTYAYMMDAGVAAERIYILEKGQKGWPYDDLLEK